MDYLTMKCKALLLTCFVAVSAHAELPSLKPNNMEAFNNYFSAAMKNEKETFLDDGDVFLVSVPTVKASDVIADYKANELKGNKNYKGKEVRIRTVASSIKEGIANKPYIVANGKNQFENIFIYIDPKDDRFLEISKGDKIDLICKGDGVIMETPVFKNCAFPEDYIDKKIDEAKASISKDIGSGGVPTTKLAAMFFMVYKASEPYIEKDCLIGEKECLDSATKMSKEDIKKTQEKSKELYEAYKDQLK